MKDLTYEATIVEEAVAPIETVEGDFSQDAFDGSLFAELTPTDPDFGQQWHLNNTGVGIDLNITDVWDDYTGNGVRVVVIDTGTDRSHPDLSANINFGLDYDYVDGDQVAEPVGTARSQHHGTAVTGIIGQVNNSVGGVGVAYDSELIIYRGYGINASYGDEVWLDAAGLGDTTGNPDGAITNGDVINMSAGTGSDVFFWTQFIQDAVDAMQTVAEDGRGGLGSVMVKSAGNSRASANSTAREESTAEAYDATRHTINVAAVERTGDVTSYSSPGSNVLTSAFAPDFGQVGIFTTDRQGTDGYNTAAGTAGDYTNTFNGTSAAAPQVSGVVALMLEANPDLGWRDVQKIIALASRNVGSDVEAAAIGSEQSTQTNGATWFWNAAGDGTSNLHWNGGNLHFSNDYGFGVIDALAAVRLAETWELTGTSGSGGTEVSETRDMDGVLVTTNYSSTFIEHSATFADDIIVQHITLNVDFDIDDLGDMEIFLISPNQTRVQLINDTGDFQAFDTGTDAGGLGWNFGSTAFLGETGNGTWRVQIRNDDGSGAGTFSTTDVDLTIYGDTRTSDDLFVYTDAFSDYAGTSTHPTNVNGGSGINTINAAAVTSNTTINLLTDTGTIDGVATTNFNIQRVFTGDGNDIVTGDSLSDFIDTGRGNDVVEGGSGAETINGGTGNDSLDGGAGDDTINGGDGSDTLNGMGGTDQLNGDAGNDTFVYEVTGNSTIVESDFVDGGAGSDKIEIRGEGTVDLTGFNANSIEEIEFRADALDSDKTLILSNKELDQPFEFSPTLLIDGNATSGSDDHIIVEVDFTDDVDISGWTFQEWNSISSNTDTITINGSANANNIVATSQDDTIFGEAGNDTIDGGAGDDSIEGGAGNDSIDGGIGNDTIEAGSGADIANGGDGDDLFLIDFGWSGNDTVNGGVGRDKIAWDGTSLGSAFTVNLQTGIFELTGGSGTNFLTSIEDAETSDGADELIGSTAANELIANGGNDTIDGGAGNDTIDGGSGDDSLTGGSGADTLIGGTGNDTLEGDTGFASSNMSGGDGNDTFLTRLGTSDTIAGGAGIDTLILTLAGTFTGDRTVDIDQGYSFNNSSFQGNWSGLENLTSAVGMQVELIGNGFDNILIASSQDDTILGEAGNDTLIGGAGNDSLDGGTGNDSLEGGDGNDTLDSGAFGADVLRGGAGNDTLIKQGAMSVGLDDTFDGGSGNDTLITDVAWTSGVTFNLAAGNASVAGSARDDLISIENIEVGGAAAVIGTSGANRIIGTGTSTSHDNVFDGGGGNDTIDGGAGDDSIEGGSGNDSIDGGTGDDTIIGGDGLDTVNAGAGNDTVFWRPIPGLTGTNGADGSIYDGGAGIDVIHGGDTNFGGVTFDLGVGTYNNGVSFNQTWTNFENYFNGNATSGDERVLGSAANNRIETGSGNNFLTGEDGNDTLIGGGGNDRLEGGSGNDSVLGGSGSDSIDAGLGNDTVLAGDGNDSVVASAGSDLIRGGTGNDTLRASGADTIFGEAGNDLIFAGVGASETLDGGAGTDTLDTTTFTGDYNIRLATGLTNFAGELFTDFENIVTGIGDDQLAGTGDANQMSGGGGDDRIRGFAGNDTLNGDSGNDTLAGGDGNDVISGGDGIDRMFGQAGDDAINGGLGNDELNGNIGNDTLLGGDGDDLLRGSDGFDVIQGGTGNDTAFGGANDDTLFGGDGDDSLDGSGDADFIDGENGNDTLVGGTGDDIMFGGLGNDAMRGGGGADVMFGDEDDDIMFGSSGEDTMSGGNGNDTLVGNQQADVLFGAVGNDVLRGGDGFDILEGGEGDDTLLGQNGNDTLEGGLGVDRLFGGAQNDTFVFASTLHSSFGAEDAINDIEGVGVAGGDIIDLSLIDANTTTAGNQAFTFLGAVSGAVALASGPGALWVENAGGQTKLFGNTDADNVIELAININDGSIITAADYTAGDFIL